MDMSNIYVYIYVLLLLCIICILTFIGNNIYKVLGKKPDKRHVVELLAQNAHEFKNLALALGVDHGFVKGLNSSDDTIINLDKIIRQWIQTRCSPVTWNTIIESVESVIFGKNLYLGEKIRNWLKEDENFAYYIEKDI